MSIPIVIGVTGHRLIEPEALPAIETAVRLQLEEIKNKYPHSPLVLLDSLASGADTICAEAALELGIGLVCPLPMEPDEYEKDFSGEELTEFSKLLGSADRYFTVPRTEPEVPGRDFLYRQAGIYVATRCHILLALWDGGAADPGGCGTAEAVSFALNGDFSKEDDEISCRPCMAKIIHIKTPRLGTDTKGAGEIRLLGADDPESNILSPVDEFNSLCEAPQDHGSDIGRIYDDADRLSMKYAKKYNRTLAFTAVLGTLISFSFLIYDEIELHFMLIVCGLLLGAGILLIKRARNSRCHERYVEYRALAEAARVQQNLYRAGSTLRVTELFGWTQYDEMPWVVSALSTSETMLRDRTCRQSAEAWITDQHDYHAGAGVKSIRKNEFSQKAVSVIYILDITVYIAALAYEILCFSGILPDAEVFRTVTKVIIGTLSAGTLFVSGYFGRLSAERTADDHKKMERFYSLMLEKYKRYGETEELLKTLAREELAENAGWYSYRIEDRPGLDL